LRVHQKASMIPRTRVSSLRRSNDNDGDDDDRMGPPAVRRAPKQSSPSGHEESSAPAAATAISCSTAGGAVPGMLESLARSNAAAAFVPPMSYVEIPHAFSSSLSSSLGDGSSSSSGSNNNNNNIAATAVNHHHPMGTPPRSIRPAATEEPVVNAMTSFRLKPRGGMAKPSPIVPDVLARGRKRSAPSVIQVSSPPRCAKSAASSEDGSFASNGSSPRTPQEEEDDASASLKQSSPMLSHQHYPTAPKSPMVSLSFQGLSLHSPHQQQPYGAAPSTDTTATTALSLPKPPPIIRDTSNGTPTSFVSGFSKIHSPGDFAKMPSQDPTEVGSSFRRFRSSSFDTVGDQSSIYQPPHARCNVDASSVGSAPKLVPLTVLTHGLKQMGSSYNNNTNHKPPLHLVQPQPPLLAPGVGCCLMHSVDREGDDNGKDQGVKTPKPPPQQHPLDTRNTNGMDATDKQEEATETASRNSARSASSHASPRSIKLTPLPRITLTPRSSGGHTTSSGALPRFPMPNDRDDIDYIGGGGTFMVESPSPRQFPPPFLDVSCLSEASGVLNDSRSLDLSVDEDPMAYKVGESVEEDEQSPSKESYIPFPDWAYAPPPSSATTSTSPASGQHSMAYKQREPNCPNNSIPRPHWGGGHSSVIATPGSQATGQSSNEEAKANRPKARSVLFPTFSPHHQQRALNEIVVQTGSCRNIDFDSLSDDEDDDEFLLASPSVIAQEKMKLQPGELSRQPKLPRLPPSYDSSNAIGGELENNRRRTSMTSLASSSASLQGLDLASSSTSLRGMEFTPSCSSLRGLDLYQSSASLRGLEAVGESQFGPTLPWQQQGGLKREESNVSIGLTLEPFLSSTGDLQSAPAEGRDLVTPPAMAAALAGPPPISPRFGSSPNDSLSKNDSPSLLFVR